MFHLDLQAGQHRLELNPFWKGGGTGLPDAAAAVPLSGTGDGGLSWLRKALQRCIETAKEENRSVEEVAAERYGVSRDSSAFLLFLLIIIQIFVELCKLCLPIGTLFKDTMATLK